MKLRPLHTQVVIRRNQAEETSKGGIIIPDSGKEKPFEGEVLAVGRGEILKDGSIRHLDVKVGDRVLFTKFGITEVRLDNEEYVILREEAILGVITNG
jgi:chaperonin GroES